MTPDKNWIPVKLRKPTKQDADVDGRILWLASPAKMDGKRYCYHLPWDWDGVRDSFYWLAIPPLPDISVPTPKFAVGQEVNVIAPLEKQQGLVIIEIPANKVYRVGKKGETNGPCYTEGELELAPWKPKYKAGDKVLLLDGDGDVIERVDLERREYALRDHCVLITEDRLQPNVWKPKFKVGDRVLVKNLWESVNDKVCCVIQQSANSQYMTYAVKHPQRGTLFYFEHELELYVWSIPTPPKDKQWHRTDGWKEEWLQDGWRPLLSREFAEVGDDWRYAADLDWRPIERRTAETAAYYIHSWIRTKRPLPPPEPEPAKVVKVVSPVTDEEFEAAQVIVARFMFEHPELEELIMQKRMATGIKKLTNDNVQQKPN